MTSMSVPEPVMSLAVQPVSKDSGGQVSRFLSILCVDELFVCIIIRGTYVSLFLSILLVLKGFESFSERGSNISCWLGS